MAQDAVDKFTSDVASHGQRSLGPQYDVTVRGVFGRGIYKTVVVVARNRNNPLPEQVLEDRDQFCFFSGYVVDRLTDSTSSRRLFGRNPGDDRPIRRSPGGIYSYVTIRRHDGQICAGHSTPTLEPIYYTQAQSGLHVGNNPLLVHVAARGFQSPEMNELFFFSGVSAGVAIDNLTPFVGCLRLAPRTLLVGSSQGLGVSVRAAPRPEYGRYKIGDYRQRTESVREALVEAGSILKRLPPGEFRLSGGKDSRLIAAFLQNARIEALPVNQNFPEEIEGQVADLVAQNLGNSSCFRVPVEDVVDRRDLRQSTRRKIAYAGGLPAAASLQYPVRSEGSVAGVPLIMGHAHLQRGGFVGRIRTVADAIATASSRTVSPFLRPAYVDQNLGRARRLVFDTVDLEGASAQTISFKAYLAYALNYQFQSLYAYVRNWNVLVSPLVDERLTSLCEDIADSPAPGGIDGHAGIIDLLSEKIAMGVTQSLAPSLLRFPLAGDRYRCDGPEWTGFDDRDPALLKVRTIPQQDLGRVFNMRTMDTQTRSELWDEIGGSVIAPFAEQACKPEIWQYVSEPGSKTPRGANHRVLNQFVWSLYGFSITLGSDWWAELATTE